MRLQIDIPEGHIALAAARIFENQMTAELTVPILERAIKSVTKDGQVASYGSDGGWLQDEFVTGVKQAVRGVIAERLSTDVAFQNKIKEACDKAILQVISLDTLILNREIVSAFVKAAVVRNGDDEC